MGSASVRSQSAEEPTEPAEARRYPQDQHDHSCPDLARVEAMHAEYSEEPCQQGSGQPRLGRHLSCCLWLSGNRRHLLSARRHSRTASRAECRAFIQLCAALSCKTTSPSSRLATTDVLATVQCYHFLMILPWLSLKLPVTATMKSIIDQTDTAKLSSPPIIMPMRNRTHHDSDSSEDAATVATKEQIITA